MIASVSSTMRGLGTVLDADVAGAVHHDCAHGGFLSLVMGQSEVSRCDGTRSGRVSSSGQAEQRGQRRAGQDEDDDGHRDGGLVAAEAGEGGDRLRPCTTAGTRAPPTRCRGVRAPRPRPARRRSAPTRPWAVIRTKKPTTATDSGMPHHSAPTSSRSPAAPVAASPTVMTVRVGTRPASRAASRVARASPTALAAKSTEYIDRRQPVHRLQHERRGGDVGERDAHREGHHDQVADEAARARAPAGRRGRAGAARRRAADAAGSDSGTATATATSIDRAQAGDHPERHPPVRQLQDDRAEQRADDRCDAADAGDQVERLRTSCGAARRGRRRPPGRSPSPSRR